MLSIIIIYLSKTPIRHIATVGEGGAVAGHSMVTFKVTRLAWMFSSDILPSPLTLQASASMEQLMSNNYASGGDSVPS